MGAGIGHSSAQTGLEAGRQAARTALEGLGGLDDLTFVIVYATILYDPDAVLQGVREVLGDTVPLAGCSVQGISHAGSVDEVDRIVGVAAVSVAGGEVDIVRTTGLAADPVAAGRRVAEALGGSDETVVVWFNPLGVDVEAMLDGLAQGGVSHVIGGGAGAPFGPLHRTLQFFGSEVHEDALVAMKPGGSLKLVHAVTSGTEPIGLTFTVTRAQGPAVLELDGVPARDVWRDQLGSRDSGVNAETASAWALGVEVRDDDGQPRILSRAVWGTDEESGAILLQAPIAQGTEVALCHRTFEAISNRAIEMASELRERLPGEPVLAMAFECAARPRPFLGDERALAEVGAMQQQLPDIPWLGHYSWGEVAPIGGRSHVFNYAFPLAVLVRVD